VHSAVRTKIPYLTQANLSHTPGSGWSPGRQDRRFAQTPGRAVPGRHPSRSSSRGSAKVVDSDRLPASSRATRAARNFGAGIRGRVSPQKVLRGRDASDHGHSALRVRCLRASCCVNCVGWPPPRGKFEPAPMERALKVSAESAMKKCIESGRLGGGVSRYAS
jgi:hypothetical protein